MCDTVHTDRIIIPPAQARRIVGGAGAVYVRACPCRAQERRCPPDVLEVCLLFPAAAKEDLAEARPIAPEEALALVERMDARGVVFQLFYTQDGHEVTELCSCCSCCCRPLRRLRREGRYREQLRSEYVAVTDVTRCTGCGACVDACWFGARSVQGDGLHLGDERCFGCGRCVASCPVDAIGIQPHAGRGVVVTALGNP